MLGMLVEGIRMSVKRFAGAWGRKHIGLVLGIIAVGFASTGFSGPMPSAANRVFLGDTQSISLAASTNPDTVKTLNVLRQQAAKNGTTRVIVGVRAAFAPEGLMSASDVALQRNEIAAAQSAVMNKVASLKQKPEKSKRFETIPFMALEVTPAELEALASLPEITSIEEDRLAAPFLTQSVPLIGGAIAWSSGYTGAGQTVAILDTGVEKTHPFLTGKVVSEACYSTNNASQSATSVCPAGVTQSTAVGSAMPYGGTCPAGGCDHGTHVAGIAAGKGVSYSGVAKDASLIAIQVFSRFDANCGSSASCVGAYTSDIILGLQRVYALRTTYSIAAVNMSLGGGQFFDQASCDAANTSTKAAIDTLRAVNIATVIASGNAGYLDSMGEPGCISSAVSVGATWDVAGVANNCAGNYLGTSTVDQIACYSNSASFLNLLAPGSAITSSIPGSGYGADWWGTSMATPHVAGAWALLKQKKVTLTVTEGLNALSSTGVSVTDSRNGIVKPRIQVNAALNAIASPCSYTLSSASLSAGAAAAVGNVNVIVATGCAWTAVSNVAWITVTSGASGSGNGAVGYSIAANTSASSRTGTLTIAGKTFTVTQNGTGILPVAPIIGTATAGNASARVVFTPGAIGSGTLLNYTASCSTNNVNFINATGSVSPITVSGLTNGTAYTCKVRATSTVGIGPLSAASNSVTPAAPISATGSLTTTFAGGLGQSGNMFDVRALSGNVTINRFDLNLYATAGTVVPVRVYYKSGSYLGYEATPSAWTLLGTYSVTSAGLGIPSSMPVGNLLLTSGQTYGIYLTTSDGVNYFSYTNGANTYANADIQATLGAAIVYPFAGTFTPRTWNGTIYYSRAGTLPLSTCSAITPATASVALGSASPLLAATCNNSPTSYVWKVGATTLTSCTGATCTVPAASIPAVGTYNVTVTANNAGGAGTQAANATITVTQGIADTFPPGGIMPAGWVQPAGSSAPWAVATDSFAVGPKSLKSGIITHSQLSGISYTTAFAAGNISFALRVSSESCCDYLRFYIDGVQKGQWAGAVAWQTVSFPITAGTHQISWKYEKDYSLSTGSDAAWIDSVSLPTQSGTLSACTAISPAAPSVMLGSASPLLIATCDNSPTSYVWKVGTTTLSCTGSTCTVPAASLPTAGTYSVTVKANNAAGAGIQAASATITVTAPAAAASTLNDTGVTASQCYQAGGTLVACNSAGALALNNAQDGMKGRDANAATNGNTDGKLGFSFASVAGGCVRDNVTGLMWEVKTTDGGLRDWNKIYSNYSATYDPFNLYGTATDATGFAAAVNTTNLCGHNDWRLPTADELQSIVDYSVASPGPTIDATWFPNTKNSLPFWSSSPDAGFSAYALLVHFYDGGIYSGFRDSGNYVRLVRAGQPPSPSRYTVSADGQEVTDNQTKLIWRRCPEDMSWNGTTCAGVAGTFTHEAALQRAAAQAGSTGAAWRLPDVKELASIVDKSRSNPAIDPTAFPATPSSWFWSASPYVGYSYDAWFVYFGGGGVGSNGRGGSDYVRLVRAGQ